MKKDYFTYSDSQLIKLATKENGDRNIAFLEIYKRYSRSLFTYCRHKFYNIDLAKEVFEQTFVDFFNAIKSGKKVENIQAYMFGIVRNALANYIREKGRKTGIEIIDCDISTINIHDKKNGASLNMQNDAEREIEQKEMINLIEDAVELLEDKEKEYYKLNKFGGMSAVKISEAFGDNPNSVKSIIYRAQSKVKNILAPYIAEINKF